MLEQRTFSICFQIVEEDFSVFDDSPVQGASETRVHRTEVMETLDTLELAQGSLKTRLEDYLKHEWWSKSECDTLRNVGGHRGIVEGTVICDGWHHITRAVFIKRIEEEIVERRKQLEPVTV